LATFSLSGLQLALPDGLLTAPIQEMIDNGWYEIEDETVKFFIPRSFWAASVNGVGLDDDPRSIAVPAISLADLLDETQPTVLMVDAEGAETGFSDQNCRAPFV